MGVFLKSPAKINLGLRIVGRRKDGYHELESLFWPITLIDAIEITTLKDSDNHRVLVEGPTQIDEESNLVMRLLKKIPNLPPQKISIRKLIPVGGGLGGGSSNAGTVLRHFVDTEIIQLRDASKIALELGADVPFFLSPVPSWVTGIGERCHPVDTESAFRENLFFIVITLTAPTSTRRVFERFQKSETIFSDRLEVPPKSFTQKSFQDFLASARNDLERFAIQETPEVESAMALLSEIGALYAGVSGSGSSCFALFDSAARAGGALNKARSEHFDRVAIYKTFPSVEFSGARLR